MLLIRDEQMTALAAGMQTRFAAQLADLFMQTYPRECQQAGGLVAVVPWVQSGLRAAAAAGYGSRYQSSRWVALTLILGVDFAVDPQLPWVQEGLDERAIPDPTERIAHLYEQTLDYLGDTAGEDAELVVRALLRMREIDFSALPLLDAEAWPGDCCERLRRLYPQKFDFQGPLLMARTVRQDLARARAFGLHGAAGEFLFVLLSFMLGSGFDHDRLHGWAGATLHTGVDGDRAQRLEAAAREHLAGSLIAAAPERSRPER